MGKFNATNPPTGMVLDKGKKPENKEETHTNKENI